MTQLVSHIREVYHLNISLEVLFDIENLNVLLELMNKKLELGLRYKFEKIEYSQRKDIPLSFAQERLWFINQLDPDNTAYNMVGAITIYGKLEVNHIEKALNLIIRRHESLRTVFSKGSGITQQIILENLDLKLGIIDITHDKEKNKKAKELCELEANTPFNLIKGPLIRAKIIKLNNDEHILLLNMHHIISDGWSIDILFKELGTILTASEQESKVTLPDLPIQYADYSIWQRKWIKESGVFEEQLSYWKEKLHGAPESLNLVTDYPRPSTPSFEGATESFLLADLTDFTKT